jgi:hypothetical protein
MRGPGALGSLWQPEAAEGTQLQTAVRPLSGFQPVRCCRCRFLGKASGGCQVLRIRGLEGGSLTPPTTIALHHGQDYLLPVICYEIAAEGQSQPKQGDV